MALANGEMVDNASVTDGTQVVTYRYSSLKSVLQLSKLIVLGERVKPAGGALLVVREVAGVLDKDRERLEGATGVRDSLLGVGQGIF